MSKLKIKDLRLWVHLGCSEAERENLHAISVTVKITFSQPPKGVHTDNLEDSLCYRHITDLTKDAVSNKEFKLVEHLTFCIYDDIHKYVSSTCYADSQIEVKVTKLFPPIESLQGGVSFSYSGN